MPLPDDDPRVIGLWGGNLLGPAAYDFYVRTLPIAGYRIVATYPGGEAAVIRFSLPDGARWQLVMRAGPQGTLRIELRPDAP